MKKKALIANVLSSELARKLSSQGRQLGCGKHGQHIAQPTVWLEEGMDPRDQSVSAAPPQGGVL